MTKHVRAEVRQILETHANLAEDPRTLSDDDDLYRLGMTSHANVNVMLALEDCFDIEFPETMLRRSTFQTVRAIEQAILALADGRVPA